MASIFMRARASSLAQVLHLQALERDDTSGRFVSGFVDVAHAALGEERKDAIAVEAKPPLVRAPRNIARSCDQHRHARAKVAARAGGPASPTRCRRPGASQRGGRSPPRRGGVAMWFVH